MANFIKHKPLIVISEECKCSTDLISGGNSGFFLGHIHRFLSRSYSANVNFSSKS